MKRLFFGLLLATTAGCQPGLSPKDATRMGARFESDSITFAFDLKSGCQLQAVEGAGPMPAKGWADVSLATYANKAFTVKAKRSFAEGTTSKTVGQALQLEDRKGNVVWVRNTPAPTVDAALERWGCAFDSEKVRAVLPKLDAAVVRLDAGSKDCNSIAPIFGDVDAVTFAPYTVTGKSLFNAKGQPVVGVRLEADGGEKVLTVSGAAFDKCFVAADKVPPPPKEALELRSWLENAGADSTAPPPVSRDTVEQLTGLSLAQCLKEGTGVLTHHECRMPIVRILGTKTAGPYGPRVIRLVRERVVDAVHLYAGHLVPSADIVTANVAVRLGKTGGPNFTRAFADELELSLVNPGMRLKRASNGFRLLRAADVSAGVPATHTVEIELSYVVPEIEAVTDHRTHKYVAGKKTIPNKAHAEAESAVEAAKEELASAKKAASVVDAAANEAANAAGDGCKKAAENAGGGMLGGLLGGALCKSGTKAAGSAAEKALVSKAESSLEEAQAKLAATPKTISIDDTREYAYEAKVYKRSGDATARISIFAAGQSSPQQTSSVTFHFEASDDEYAASPEHKLAAKTARVPNSADVEKQLASNVLRRIDEAIIRWGAQRQVGGDIGELQPGTRSWMVAVARHAASDRNVKLLSDLLEKRADKLDKEAVTYPVKVPAKTEGRCFTFAAIPLDPTADVNLELGRLGKDDTFTPFAVDDRPAPDAAFEVCDLPTGNFAVRLSHGKAISKAGVLVSMFDSTPGGPTAEDTITGSKGIPTMARKGEELVLNGEGVVQFRGTNNKVVTGKTGDRDGDGIPDDEDRCPYDPETVNGYLDEDGCPDVAPAGTPAPAPKGQGK